ncbi:MerR family transcriptional regulator [bacterium]|nr:MerR family transcriptional regulator [bacterium]
MSTANRQPSDQNTEGHPISVVVRRTGLSQDILRAWEKRYEAVTPLRTATGRRLYTEEHVAKLRLLKQLVDGGRRISDVADLDLETLRRLADEDASEAVVGPRLTPRRAVSGYLATCIEAVDRLDRHGLEQALDTALVALSRPRLRSDVLVPLIHALGERWQAGTWRVVHEHLASAVLRTFLWQLWRRSEPVAGSESVVVATPAGQRHELGALLVSGVAADLGWRVVYLGCDLPSEEIAAAVQTSQSRAVLLSLVYPMNELRMFEEIRRLRGLLTPEVEIVAGGRAAPAGRDELEVAGVVVADSLDDLAAILESIVPDGN